MASLFRKFEGHRYHLQSTYNRKSEAVAHAIELRERHKKVRVVKSKEGWHIYLLPFS